MCNVDMKKMERVLWVDRMSSKEVLNSLREQVMKGKSILTVRQWWERAIGKNRWKKVDDTNFNGRREGSKRTD